MSKVSGYSKKHAHAILISQPFAQRAHSFSQPFELAEKVFHNSSILFICLSEGDIRMYFVVFIHENRKYFIVPSSWIKEIDSNWQKFINNGVNTNQVFTVFYSESRDAMDEHGKPNSDYAAKFSDEMKKFPEEGCYFANILKYFGKFSCTYKV